MMLEQKKSGPVRGCIVPLLAAAGFIALCYVFCLVLFLINQGAITSTSGVLLFGA